MHDVSPKRNTILMVPVPNGTGVRRKFIGEFGDEVVWADLPEDPIAFSEFSKGMLALGQELAENKGGSTSESAVVAKSPITRRPFLRLHEKDGKFGVSTNIEDEFELVFRLADEIVGQFEAIYVGPEPAHAQRNAAAADLCRGVLAPAIDIICKLRGYKAESVRSYRVLEAGDISFDAESSLGS